MAIDYNKLTEKHPCFAKYGHGGKGRIHLPVSPGCNIECKFCNRKINDYENRPGVTSEVIKVSEVESVIKRALELCPEITVAGIAGPGDTLATPYALQTFEIVSKKFPSLVKCMSTNGLLLPEKADAIINANIDSLTVTVNAVTPEIEAQLNRAIYYHGKRYEGVEAAEILINNQIEGIKKISQAGITVKVNTVLVPNINANDIEAIAKTVAEAGAKFYNIIPLIPQADLINEPAPDCKQLFTARYKAKKYIKIYRHCQRCRADAVGVPGKSDFSKQVYIRRVAKDTFSHA